jgi:BASS family bile acid:Na+ symporter
MFDFYPAYEEHFAQVQLILFMLGMGATLKIGDFAQILRQPRSLIVALLGQVIASPLIALGVNHLFGLSGGIALGLILTSAMPGGAIAKAFVILGRGNAPLAISLAALSTLLSIITVPLTLEIFAREYIPAEFVMPIGKIVRDVSLFLLAPLAAGMSLGALWPAWRKAFNRTFISVGFVVVVAMVVFALGSQRIKPGQHGWKVPIAIILFALLCMQANMLPFRLWKWPRGDKLTAGVEISMRNMNLAILLNVSLFPDTPGSDVAALAPEVMFVILFYAGAAMGVGLPLALNYLRMARRDARHLNKTDENVLSKANS